MQKIAAGSKQWLSRFIGLTVLISQPYAMAVDLIELYQQSVTYDSEFAIAEAGLLSEGEQVERDRAPLLPNLQISYSKNFVRREENVLPDQEYEDDIITYRMTQPLFNVNRWYNFKQSQVLFEDAKIRFDGQKQQLIIRVAEAYFDVLRAQDNLSTTQSEKDFLTRELERTNKQFNVGLVPVTDVYEVRSALDLVKVDLINDKNNLRISFQALETLTGNIYQSVQSLQETIPIELPMPNDREYWLTQALQSNLSILSAKRRQIAAKHILAQSKGNHFPTIDLVARYTDNEGSRFTEQDFTDKSVAIELNIPLYEGGGTQAEVRQAYHQLEASELNVKLQGQTVTQEVRRLFETVVTDVSSVQAQKQAIISSESSLKAMREGYRAGTRDIFDVLNAQTTLYAAIRDHANAQYGYILNRLRLYQVTGILKPEHLVELNQLLVLN